MASNERVVIVGGGVVGLSAAYHCLLAGRAVRVIERGGEHSPNCSTGNAGMVVPSHFVPLAAPGMIAKGLRWMFNPESPFYIRPRPSAELIRWGWLFWRHANAGHVACSRELLRDLNLESRRLFAELAGEADFGLQQRGLLMLCKTSKALEEEADLAAAAAEIGIQARVLDPRETARLDPGIAMDVAGAVHFPQDCHLDPGRFLDTLRRRVLAMGGEVTGSTVADGFEIADGRVSALRAAGERHEGSHFVVAGGVWSPALLRQLGLRLPMQAGKGYSLTLPAPRELPELCSILVEAKVAVTPMGAKLRFAGTMEIGANDLRIDRRRVRGIVRSVSSYFPEFRVDDFDGIEPWVGLRPVSPDGLPYLGKVPAIDNLIVATGHAMMGLSLGPVSGRLVADLVAGEKTHIGIGKLAPARFG
ncbi:MAG: NAD(P)/FAD-dependent oxidoreductase [Luteolibacter sp.]